jgi:hypothetical protein
MKLVPDLMHGLGLRPHYEPAELDRTFEKIASAHLRRRHGAVDYPLTTDDLTVLIEEHVEELDLYADLTNFGTGVEGVTTFKPGANPKVLISSHLGEAEARENRLRTTLAHEFGHVHLHSYIIDLAIEEGRLDRVKGSKITCKRETMLTAPQKDWREWQAGYACGAILMPAARMTQLAADWRGGWSGPAASAMDALVGEIAKRFLVSRDAAAVRLRVLNLAPALQS